MSNVRAYYAEGGGNTGIRPAVGVRKSRTFHAIGAMNTGTHSPLGVMNALLNNPNRVTQKFKCFINPPYCTRTTPLPQRGTTSQPGVSADRACGQSATPGNAAPLALSPERALQLSRRLILDSN